MKITVAIEREINGSRYVNSATLDNSDDLLRVRYCLPSECQTEAEIEARRKAENKILTEKISAVLDALTDNGVEE